MDRGEGLIYKCIFILNQMGFSFRRSASFGIFRLNFSKSGVGASIGVKGARLTMMPRGITYITVGSHGFYYRETISSPSRVESSTSPQDLAGTSPFERKISTADALDLIKNINRLYACNRSIKAQLPADLTAQPFESFFDLPLCLR